LRLGLIGVGKHGQRYLQPSNGGPMALVHYRSATADRLGFPVPAWVAGNVVVGESVEETSDADRFFASDLQGCIIASPPATHRDLCLRAFAAGLPVLCEKPLALTYEDCRDILDAADKTGLPLLVGHTHLFSEAFEGLPRGERKTMIRIGGPRPGHDYSALFDWGSHAVAMALALSDYRQPLWWKVWPNSADAWDIAIQYRNGEQTIRIGTERVLSVESEGGVIYTGQESSLRTPMANMVEVFQKLIAGGNDPRATLDFTRLTYGILCTSSEVEKVN
jgi:hypothetical protein